MISNVSPSNGRVSHFPLCFQDPGSSHLRNARFSKDFQVRHAIVTLGYEGCSNRKPAIAIMNIAVISDLHLGSGDIADNFGHSEQDFIRFLSRLENDFERIVLLGDVWETLTSHRLFDAGEGLRRAREAHPELARRFERSKYLYVHGNHDLIAASEGVPSELVLNVDGVRLLFTHGHHHDWLIMRARWFSETMVWLGAWVRRFKLSALYRFGYLLDKTMSTPPEQSLKDTFQAWAFSLAKLKQVDVIVTGHTHYPMRSERDSRLFLNSGCCTEGKSSYLAIDTKCGRYDVLQA